MGLYSGVLIIGRIFASEIEGGGVIFGRAHFSFLLGGEVIIGILRYIEVEVLQYTKK